MGAEGFQAQFRSGVYVRASALRPSALTGSHERHTGPDRSGSNRAQRRPCPYRAGDAAMSWSGRNGRRGDTFVVESSVAARGTTSTSLTGPGCVETLSDSLGERGGSR